MSFLKKLLGLKSNNPSAPQSAEVVASEIEYKGFLIRATPYLDNGQYQVSGMVSKLIDGKTREHKFIRADKFATLEDAINISEIKGRQMIDQMGERLFDR